MHDNRIRNLEGLRATGDSSRVLNLVSIWSQSGHLAEYRERPFFENRMLNKSLILKHRLRDNEHDLFSVNPTVATKIILPIDNRDWKLGGRYVFIGQKDYLTVLRNTFGESLFYSDRDQKVLDVLSSAPSLDPFLLKELLFKSGITISICYFNIAKPDLIKMNSFLKIEISKLVRYLYSKEENIDLYTEKLVAKIIAGRIDDGLEHLRLAMNLSPEHFEEGIFSWRGFLYYKWSYSNIAKSVSELLGAVMGVKASGLLSEDMKKRIMVCKVLLKHSIIKTMMEIKETLNIYDRSYTSLFSDDNPNLFRDFLLMAPTLFYRLGSQLGMINYMCNFWNYRFYHEKNNNYVGADELIDLLEEFQRGVSSDGKIPVVTW